MIEEQNIMAKRIVDFINEHHIFNLATSHNNQPWTATCFYVFNEKEQSIIFTTDDHTRHAQEMMDNPTAAGTIALETKTIGKIRGVQFSGNIRKLSGKQKTSNKLLYLKAFPYAILTNTSLWAFDIHLLKMTDNRLGFGKKLHWSR